jgi:hypothetical protein
VRALFISDFRPKGLGPGQITTVSNLLCSVYERKKNHATTPQWTDIYCTVEAVEFICFHAIYLHQIIFYKIIFANNY